MRLYAHHKLEKYVCRQQRNFSRSSFSFHSEMWERVSIDAFPSDLHIEQEQRGCVIIDQEMILIFSVTHRKNQSTNRIPK